MVTVSISTHFCAGRATPDHAFSILTQPFDEA